TQLPPHLLRRTYISESHRRTTPLLLHWRERLGVRLFNACKRGLAKAGSGLRPRCKVTLFHRRVAASTPRPTTSNSSILQCSLIASNADESSHCSRLTNLIAPQSLFNHHIAIG